MVSVSVRVYQLKENTWVRAGLFALAALGIWQLNLKFFDSFILTELIPFFSKLSFTLGFEIISLTFTLVTLAFLTIRITNKYVDSPYSLAFWVVIGIIYSYYRIDSNYLLFKYYWLDWLAYGDVILTFFGYSLLSLRFRLFRHFNTESQEKIESNTFNLENDEAISSLSDDLLFRSVGARKLAELVNRIDFNKPFSLGINSSWGDGKSSFLYLLCDELKKDNNTTLVHFNPWKFSEPSLIQSEFFSILKEVLSPYSSTIGTAIDNYTTNLVKLEKTGSLNFLFNSFNKKSEPLKQFNEVENAISLIDRKIIVIIDDLDRLNPKEIMAIFKLIRNTGHFKNLTFIAAYDRNYINECIAKEIPDNLAHNFSDKIFQLEIDLPGFPPDFLVEYLISLIKKKKVFNEKKTQQLINGLSQQGPIFSQMGMSRYDKIVKNNLANIRDVKRFVNSFLFSISPIIDEIDIVDFFYLRLLKQRYPEAYYSLKNREYVTSDSSDMTRYKFDSEKHSSIDAELKEILNILIPEGIQKRSFNSINIKKKFPIYFSDRVFYGFSFKELNIALKEDGGMLSQKLKEWENEQKLALVGSELASVGLDYFSNKDEVSNYITILFEVCAKGFSFSKVGFWPFFFYPEDERLKYYQLINLTPEEVKTQIAHLFENQNWPNHLSDLLAELMRHHIYKNAGVCLFSHEELLKIAEGYLGKALEKEDLDRHSIRLFYSCFQSINVAVNSEITLSTRACGMMRAFIKSKNNSFYLNSFFRDYGTPNVESLFTVEPFVNQIFGSFENFVKYINSLSESKSKKTFKEYIAIYLDKDKKPFHLERGLHKFNFKTEIVASKDSEQPKS